MTIKLTIEGLQVEVSTVSEALELIRGMKGEVAPQQRSLTEPVRVKANGYITPAGALGWATDFLTAIRTAGPAGIPTSAVVSALGLNHLKAVGGRMAIVNKVLEHRSFRPQDVYSNEKTPEGVRLWRPKHKIDAAYAAIRQEQGKQ